MSQATPRLRTRLGLVVRVVGVVRRKTADWMKRLNLDRYEATRDRYVGIRMRMIEVRGAVEASASRRIDLRDYLREREQAWDYYVRVQAIPGRTTRRATVLRRLEETIAGLNSTIAELNTDIAGLDKEIRGL